jgi:Flp pilus assembly protein TadD
LDSERGETLRRSSQESENGNLVPLKLPEAQNEMGYALRNLGRNQEAVQAYQEAIRSNPNMGLAHLGLADVYYYNTRTTPKPRTLISAGSSCDPATRLLNTTSAGVTTISSVTPEAADELRKAIQIKPNYPEAHNELGYALHQLRRYQEAIQQYMMAIQQKTITPRPITTSACRSWH